MEKSAVAEHAWENHLPIDWEETTVLDHGRGQEHAYTCTYVQTYKPFNKIRSYDAITRIRTGTVGEGGPAHPDDTLRKPVPGCWIAVMRRQGGRSNPHQPLTSNDVYPQQCRAINSNVSLHLFTFALMTTAAFSQNVGKLFSDL